MLETMLMETRAGGPAAACAILGVTLRTWYGYRSGERKTPLYVKRSIRAHLKLSDKEFKKLLAEHGGAA